MGKKPSRIKMLKNPMPILDSSCAKVMPARKLKGYGDNTNAGGYGYRWRQFRKRYLMAHPLCVHCQAEGRITEATELDHVVPHRGDMEAFWQGAVQGLCKPHHSAKTATEE